MVLTQDQNRAQRAGTLQALPRRLGSLTSMQAPVPQALNHVTVIAPSLVSS